MCASAAAATTRVHPTQSRPPPPPPRRLVPVAASAPAALLPRLLLPVDRPAWFVVFVDTNCFIADFEVGSAAPLETLTCLQALGHRSARVFVVMPYVVLQELEAIKARTGNPPESDAAKLAVQWACRVYTTGCHELSCPGGSGNSSNAPCTSSTAAGGGQIARALNGDYAHPHFLRAPLPAELGTSFVVQDTTQRFSPHLPFSIRNRDDELLDCGLCWQDYYRRVYECEPELTGGRAPLFVFLTADRSFQLKIHLQDAGFLVYSSALEFVADVASSVHRHTR